MVRKVHRTDEEEQAAGSGADFAGSVKASAQQIWLAGLGAFARAQEEGGKVFETLVKEGVTLQRKTQSVAGEKLNDASGFMASLASELSTKAAGQWDRLETIFEDRVARALQKLGVPSAGAVQALMARVEELERTVGALRADAPPARRPGRSAARTPAHKAAAQRPAAKAVRKRVPGRKTGGI